MIDFQVHTGLSTLTELPTEVEFVQTYTQMGITKRVTKETENVTVVPNVKDLIDLYAAESKNTIVRNKTVSMFLMLEADDKTIVPAWIYLSDDYVYLSAAHNDSKVTDWAITKLATHFPKKKPSNAKQVPVAFWTFGKNGPHKKTRNIEVDTYEDIKDNYCGTNHDIANKLVSFNPIKGGQVFLLSGCAGTGKSRLIMSLFSAWKQWASFSYVVDPMTLFGGSAEYLNTVLFDEQYNEFDEIFDIGTDENDHEAKWRVILMEDVGELLSPDAAAKTGQGLSQLLNATDGVIGQGLKILFIITTNEKIEKLHPAVSRPGRCAMRHEFTPFSEIEANAWLEKHKVSEVATKEMTLAELYALKDGGEVKSTEKDGRGTIGFRATK